MKEKIQELLIAAQKALKDKGVLPSEMPTVKATLERPRHKAQGDYASNIAWVLAKEGKQSPRTIAEQIIREFPASPFIEKVEVAGGGFINFYVLPATYGAVIERVLTEGKHYGSSNLGQNRKVLIEFVSANPTGPLHVGHGRGAACGASLANILSASGFSVHREYYVNNVGRQMDILAVSVWLRYLELLGGQAITLPLNTYVGHYIIDIAQAFMEKVGRQFYALLPGCASKQEATKGEAGERELDALLIEAKSLLGEEKFTAVRTFGEEAILKDIQEDLTQFGVTFDAWYKEQSHFRDGKMQKVIERLDATGDLYHHDGALWFNSSKYGDEKDRVVRRGNGELTYFASDLAYHLTKVERGFDVLINIVGADHHGYTTRLTAAMKALGYPKILNFILVQFAVLTRGKERLSMSTRSGVFVTLRELREMVGNDAARFFYVMRKSSQHMNFDCELARSKSHENPVYTIQYAHARVASVFKKLAPLGWRYDQTMGLQNVGLLKTKEEERLLGKLSEYPDCVEAAAKQYEPHPVAHYLQECAGCFHRYYNEHRVLVEEPPLRNARLALSLAVKQVVANGLSLLGVSAPDTM
ncbi:MAG: arginine--tRNA ligase [Gammaproteobacteria bacterium]|nr:arginine--tRNA ligase [Gammaproteobacteria bacterium]